MGASAHVDERAGERTAGRYRPYIVLLAVVLAAGALSQTPPGQGVLRALGVAGGTAGYTELAFADPRNLPREPLPAETISPAFAVHNATGSARRYRWSLTLTSGGSTAQATGGELSLGAGRGTTVTPKVALRCVPGPMRVAITLEGTGESIAFQATCPPADAGSQS